MAANFQAIHAGQHQVEDQRIPAALAQLLQTQVAIGAMAYLIAFVAQVQPQQVGAGMASTAGQDMDAVIPAIGRDAANAQRLRRLF
ncbi:hypothetical protein HDE71_000804 [Janthinobacterium sp. S3M3]|nr:hypothetical protein [Janthinobacterium sp. S3T4]MBB5611807.1 hypothetical protein [Janthinobacterium sp. S3M3]